MGMNEQNEKNIQEIFQQQTLDALQVLVSQAADSRFGSFSERNPLLGKMVRCPYCRKRRRQNTQIPCCNPNYTVRAMQTDEDGNETIPITPKQKGRKNPRLTRHRPPLFLLRQRLLDLEAEGDLMALKMAVIQDDIDGQVHEKGSKWGHTPQKQVSAAHAATFMERVILKELKLSAKRKRQTQKESRRINRTC